MRGLRPTAKILDVGCGNNSPLFTKEILPGCHYTGIDVGDYNQSTQHAADRYLIATADGFAAGIGQFKNEFDAVISTHNLEHCNDRDGVLGAMLGAVKSAGYLYLSFPCEASVNFPRRPGPPGGPHLCTLNYYDDPTHQAAPPDYRRVIDEVRSAGFNLIYATPRYRPLVYRFLGALLEGKSRAEHRVFVSTWAYWGFETVIIARKRA